MGTASYPRVDNLDLKSNRIGDFEGLSPDSDLLHTLSRNLTKCNYTTIDKLKANNDELSILSLNIRSLKTNFHKLQLIDHKLTKFDVVCLQETGIDPDDMFSPGFYSIWTVSIPPPCRNHHVAPVRVVGLLFTLTPGPLTWTLSKY